MKYLLITVLVLLYQAAESQKIADREAIKSLCGCYEVNFEFGETFAPDSAYKFYPNYQSKGLEWIQLVEDEKRKIVLQHLLIVKDSSGNEQIVKHWREDWLYENTEFHFFVKDNHWKYLSLPKESVKGQWTQRVYQVDDSPRYQASATWVHVDGRRYWEGIADSPLPRREFTKRSDYNVLQRRNRHEIVAMGWIHEQDNKKILRQGADKLIAREKGWVTYNLAPPNRCKAAQDWWATNKPFWAEVRKVWESICVLKKDITLQKTVDGKPLFMHLFELEPTEKNQVEYIIKKFVIHD